MRLCHPARLRAVQDAVHSAKDAPHVQFRENPLQELHACRVAQHSVSALRRRAWKISLGWRLGWVGGASLENHQFPLILWHVVAQNVDCLIVASHLEVAMLGIKPAVHDLNHFDATATQEKAHRSFVAAITGVAFNAYGEIGFNHLT